MLSDVQKLFNEQLHVFETARKHMLIDNAQVIDQTGEPWAKKHVRHHILTCYECFRFTHVFIKEREGVARWDS